MLAEGLSSPCLLDRGYRQSDVIDLADIRDVSVFAEQIGTQFRVEIEPDHYVNAKLVEADAMKARTDGEASRAREPFSLLFKVDGGVTLPQRTYQVRHETLGELPLFLVPVGDGISESSFN